MKQKHLHKLPLLLAAALQILPICRNVCTNPAFVSTFAIVFRWVVGVTAASASFDAVSGATTVFFDNPKAVTGTVGSNLTHYLTLGGQVGTDGGTLVFGAPLPPGFTITTMVATNSAGDVTADWGVLSGTPTNTMSNVLINLVATNPYYTNNLGVPIQVTGSLYVSAVSSSTPIVISTQPTNVVATNTQPVSFSVVATGTGPFTYQWYKGDTNIINHISTATNATYSFNASTNTATASAGVNSGVYIVRVSGPAGLKSSAPATLTVNSATLAITAPPTNTSANVGSPAVLTVTATGNPTITYQWYKNGTTKITGATNNSYTIASVVLTNAGDYTVLVTNSLRKLTSSIATLTVTTNSATAPSITTQPTNFTAVAGQPASFTAVANGTAPLSYQWTKNASNISGATNSNWGVANVRVSDAGTYALVVTNAAGSVTSSNALLTITIPAAPTLATQDILGNQFRFTFTPVVGLTNSVLTNTTVNATGSWGILTNIPPPPTAATITVTDPISGDAKLYRVRIQP